ncbi:hypothetical protein FJZ23_01065 [Candidatus Parcubacteria bacterium]|nr:hypothetical protein [Candidatus Parcubacteria bacterium]
MSMSDGRPGAYPSSAVVHGRAVLVHFWGRWVGLKTRVGLERLGLLANKLEQGGIDWRQLTSTEEVITRGEEAIQLANHPLIVERGLQLAWLANENGGGTGEAALAAIEEAIQIAEKLGEDWRSWPSAMTTGQVIAHELPRLVAKAKMKPKRPSKGQRAHLRREKALARERAEAEKRASSNQIAPPAATEEPLKFSPGSILRVNGLLHIVCTGKGGKCYALVPFAEARVGSIGSVRRLLNLRRYDMIDQFELASVSLCRACADHLLPNGSQTISEAEADRDRVIALIETRQEEERLARERAEADRHEALRLTAFRTEQARTRARRAASGGAFGDPAKPKRPPEYMTRKTEKAEASRAAQHKGPSGGGNRNQQKKGGKHK